MDIKAFYNKSESCIGFTREQASQFAKTIAGDFNPIHDIDNRRFCVPGDLLFAMTLCEVGVSQDMRFDFENMVTEQTQVQWPEEIESHFQLKDQQDKGLLSVQMQGETTRDVEFIQNLIEKYVQFSGRTFPEILVALMKEKGVMINPARPLIIYKDMAVHIDAFPQGDMRLDYAGAEMQVDGKKGSVKLKFDLFVDGDCIGHGTKDMVLSGLRQYDQAIIDEVVENYNQQKASYLNG